MTTKNVRRLGIGVFGGALVAACSSATPDKTLDPSPTSGTADLHARTASPRAIGSLHVPDAVTSRLAVRVGTPSPSFAMHVTVSLPLTDEPGLDALLADVYDPSSPGYRHYLSVAEFTRRFAPTEASYRQAASFFAAQGLAVHATAPNHMVMDMDGTVADVERVFHVSIGLYGHPTEARQFFAPDREPTLDLATPILHVTGLDSYDLPRPRLVREATPRVGTGSGPKGSFLGSDVRAAYYGTGKLTGTGQSLGLMELEGYNIADVDTYFTTYGPPLTASVVGIATDSAPITCGKKCDDSEQALDIEYAIAMAPGLDQVQVYVGSNAEDVLSRMASDATSLQLSTSWGWGAKEGPTDVPLFKEMAAQGQTLLTASGDYSSLKASGPWPEESGMITGVGGTDLVAASPGGAWSAETGWSSSAGGPSVDTKILIRPYQLPFVTTANMGSTTLRNVPDIAAAARGFYFCADGGCGGGGAGTSFASPIWAGFIALANQRAAGEGKPPVGFLNPTLYALAGRATYTSALHDVTSGTSGLYSAGPVYDLVTGLGSPQGEALIHALVGP